MAGRRTLGPRYWLMPDKWKSDEWGDYIFMRVLRDECIEDDLDEESWLRAVEAGFARFGRFKEIRELEYPVNTCGPGYRYWLNGETALFFLTLFRNKTGMRPEYKCTFSLLVGDWRASDADAGQIFHIAVQPARGSYEFGSHCGACQTIIKYNRSESFIDNETKKAKRLSYMLGSDCELHAHIFHMSAFDFSCYIVSQYLLPDLIKSEGMDVTGLVMAILMGSHARLGSSSLLGTLDPAVFQFFVYPVLPPTIRGAVAAGLVRL